MPVVVVPSGQLVHSNQLIRSLYVPCGHGIQGKVRLVFISVCDTVKVYPAIHSETDINKSSAY